MAGTPTPGGGPLRPGLLLFLFRLFFLESLFVFVPPVLVLFFGLWLVLFFPASLFPLASDACGALVQGVREVAEFAVGSCRQSLAARVLEFAAHLLVEVGDLGDLLEFAEPVTEQLLRFQAETAACEIGGHSEGESPLLGPAEDVAAGDCGSESDLR
ncbi:hypothetical protein BIV23_33045 [Streptomyces monashensis]|uniref:Uncharacterized protein n=1 Tax=Streptomyces monashensis TaxID=1678012 RepID=A0A1S2PS97_9ACTN|nr:hypothetical protein BIV23_33045 [Streptomyces monashensis]